jgi:hypothetical protein
MFQIALCAVSAPRLRVHASRFRTQLPEKSGFTFMRVQPFDAASRSYFMSVFEISRPCRVSDTGDPNPDFRLR